MCLATHYNFRTNDPDANTEDSEDTTRTRRDGFIAWPIAALNTAPGGTIDMSMDGNHVPIQHFRTIVLNDPNQVRVAGFAGPGWNFGVNVPIPEGQSQVRIGAHGEQVYRIERVRYRNERDRGLAPEKDKGNKENYPKNSQILVQ